MRKESRETKEVKISGVQRYHEGGWGCGEAYAFMGFESNKYFTSDRWEKLNEFFQRLSGRPLCGFGLEIETACNGINNQVVYAEVLNKIILDMFPHDLFKLQNDSSLRGATTAECITQVMTQQFIRNHYSAFKAMYDVYFPAFQIECNESCGMHVNISLACFGPTKEKQDEAIRKFLYYINHHYNVACSLVARDRNRTYYCKKMAAYDSISECQSADLNDMDDSHGNCINASHYGAGRIELRLVGGQRSFGQFRNTMEVVFYLVKNIGKCSWKALENDYAAPFYGCNQYVRSRFDKLAEDGVIGHSDPSYVKLCSKVVREELL